MTINGLSANSLTVSGNNLTPGFIINSSATASISRLTITNGRIQDANRPNGTNGTGQSGNSGGNATGGVSNSRTLTLSFVTISNCLAIGGKGGDGGSGTTGTTGRRDVVYPAVECRNADPAVRRSGRPSRSQCLCALKNQEATPVFNRHCFLKIVKLDFGFPAFFLRKFIILHEITYQ